MSKYAFNPFTGKFDIVATAADFEDDFVNVTGDSMTGDLEMKIVDIKLASGFEYTISNTCFTYGGQAYNGTGGTAATYYDRSISELVDVTDDAIWALLDGGTDIDCCLISAVWGAGGPAPGSPFYVTAFYENGYQSEITTFIDNLVALTVIAAGWSYPDTQTGLFTANGSGSSYTWTGYPTGWTKSGGFDDPSLTAAPINSITLDASTGDITNTGDLNASGDLNATGDVGGATLTITGNSTIGGTLGVTGLTTLTDDLLVNGGKIGTTADEDLLELENGYLKVNGYIDMGLEAYPTSNLFDIRDYDRIYSMNANSELRVAGHFSCGNRLINDASRGHDYSHPDKVIDVIEDDNQSWAETIASGNTDSYTADDELNDSGGDFVNDGVTVGERVWSGNGGGQYAYVTAVTATKITVDANIFPSSPLTYQVYDWNVQRQKGAGAFEMFGVPPEGATINRQYLGSIQLGSLDLTDGTGGYTLSQAEVTGVDATGYAEVLTGESYIGLSQFGATFWCRGSIFATDAGEHGTGYGANFAIEPNYGNFNTLGCLNATMSLQQDGKRATNLLVIAPTFTMSGASNVGRFKGISFPVNMVDTASVTNDLRFFIVDETAIGAGCSIGGDLIGFDSEDMSDHSSEVTGDIMSFFARGGSGFHCRSVAEYMNSDASGYLDLHATTRIDLNAPFSTVEQSSDPSDPAEGNAVFWMGDGTGSGDDGDLLYMEQSGAVVSTGSLKWKEFTPSSITETVDDGTTGDQTDVATKFDDSGGAGSGFYQVEELNATPAYDIEFNFTNVDKYPQFVNVRYEYIGSNTHYCTWDIYNYTGTRWDQLEMYVDSKDYWVEGIFFIPPSIGDDYVDGSGNAKIRTYHHTAGNQSHYLKVDYVALIHSLQGVI